MRILIRNSDVKRVLIGVPEGHKHVRTIIELRDGTLLEFQEATVANIVRGFVTVKFHPRLDALELIGIPLEERKEGYAEYQLVESDRAPSEIRQEIRRIIEEF